MKPADAKVCARERSCLKFMSPPAPWVRMMAVRASLTEASTHRAASRNFAPNGTFTLTWKPLSSWLIWPSALLQQWRKIKLQLAASHLSSVSFKKFNRTIFRNSFWTRTLGNIVVWLSMHRRRCQYLPHRTDPLLILLNVTRTYATPLPPVGRELSLLFHGFVHTVLSYCIQISNEF